MAEKTPVYDAPCPCPGSPHKLSMHGTSPEWDDQHYWVNYPVSRATNDVVPCKWCNKNTQMISTRECDNCHELRARLTQNPDLAKVMLSEILSN